MQEREHIEQVLGLLLDGREDADGYIAARECLLRDSALREEYAALQPIGTALEMLGAALDEQAGTVDLFEDVRDAIAHHALEELAVASASPFRDVERTLWEMKATFDAGTESVSLVADVMAAVAASRKTDEEVERPFAEVALGLNGLGAAAMAGAPTVELVEPVMRAAAKRGGNVVPMRARPAAAKSVRVNPRKPKWRALVACAAALGLCSGAWWIYILSSGGATNSVSLPGAIGTNAGGGTSIALLPERGGVALPGSTAPDKPDSPVKTGGSSANTEGVNRGSKAAPLTLQEVINARRRDLVNDTRAIAAMASLTEEEAIALLKEMNLSVEALIGATQFLPSEDAIAVLRAAIAEHPDDPNLRYALARNLADDPDAFDERMEQLSQLAAADPENGLPHYMMASDYLERGEMALGLDALSRGAAYSNASAYTLESAQEREAALVASGLNPDVARFLALSTSGETEYGDISSLRNELLDYGAYYEGLGEFETARQIYNAVNQLGQQLTLGADMAVEQQYGLETQQEALLAIQGIAEAFQEPGVVAMLGETLATLASTIGDVAQYIQVRQDMVLNPATANSLDWSTLLQHMMANGDLNIADFLQ